MNQNTKRLIIFLIFSMTPTQVFADENKHDLNISFDAYPYLEDVKDDSDLTITINAELPYRISYFSFVNFKHVFRQGSPALRITEQNLRWQITEKSPFDLTLQANLKPGNNNDRFMLGISWRLSDTRGLSKLFESLNMFYRITFLLKQFDPQGDEIWQMEHFFLMKFPWLSNRLYLSGFVDHTFNQKVPDNVPDRPIISEVQFGVRLLNNFYFVSEYRINENRRRDVNNFALGIEYKTAW